MSDAPPALTALYASERAAGGAPAADRERIRNAVLATVGVTAAAGGTTSAEAGTSAATTAAGGIAGKLVIVLVTLGAIGGGAALLSRDAGTDGAGTVTEARTSREPAASAPTAPIAALPSSRGPAASPAASSEPRASLPSAAASAPLPSSTPASSTPAVSTSRTPRSVAARAMATAPAAAGSAAPSESDVQRLARAVALSARGDHAGALVLLDGVSGTSAVVEERDALRVLTFAKLGRTDEACAAVAAFVARHPHSIHRAAVEEVPCPSAR